MYEPASYAASQSGGASARVSLLWERSTLLAGRKGSRVSSVAGRQGDPSQAPGIRAKRE
jgi:hypothetical protein